MKVEAYLNKQRQQKMEARNGPYNGGSRFDRLCGNGSNGGWSSGGGGFKGHNTYSKYNGNGNKKLNGKDFRNFPKSPDGPSWNHNNNNKKFHNNKYNRNYNNNHPYNKTNNNYNREGGYGNRKQFRNGYRHNNGYNNPPMSDPSHLRGNHSHRQNTSIDHRASNRDIRSYQTSPRSHFPNKNHFNRMNGSQTPPKSNSLKELNKLKQQTTPRISPQQHNRTINLSNITIPPPAPKLSNCLTGEPIVFSDVTESDNKENLKKNKSKSTNNLWEEKPEVETNGTTNGSTNGHVNGNSPNVNGNSSNVNGNSSNINGKSSNDNGNDRRTGEPVSLKNLGNTCYMNSMVQSLFSLTEFHRVVIEKSKRVRVMNSKLDMTNTLLDLYREYRRSMQNNASGDDDLNKKLSDLKTRVGDKSSQFKSNYQQDAVEFLELILGTMEDEFDSFKGLFAKEENPVRTFFEMHLDSTLECIHCHHKLPLPKVKTHAMYLCIPEVTKDTNFSLQDAVINYFHDERTEHKCERTDCDSNEKIRSTHLSKVPKVLFIQLGRYSEEGSKRHETVYVPSEIKVPYRKPIGMKNGVGIPAAAGSESSATPASVLSNGLNGNSSPLKKSHEMGRTNASVNGSINGSVNGSINGSLNGSINGSMNGSTNGSFNGSMNGSINGSHFGSQDKSALNGVHEDDATNVQKYQLTAVVCHHGMSLAGGHYVSFVRRSNPKDWFLCDDDIITASSLEKVQEGSKQSGYCFFYVSQ